MQRHLDGFDKCVRVVVTRVVVAFLERGEQFGHGRSIIVTCVRAAAGRPGADDPGHDAVRRRIAAADADHPATLRSG